MGFSDDEGLRKPLSIASSPFEKDLIFVVRITDSAFKRTLKELSLRASVQLDAPLGTFLLPDDTGTPVVFLAGGIGIAPFRSMVLQAGAGSTGHNITLFYSSRVPGEAVFLDELKMASERHPNIRLVLTITRVEGAGMWAGLTGRINPEMIREGCREWESAVYYVSGPPIMADGMRAMLGQLGIGRERIKTEIWPGY
jgi:ferredoxin-NADP reductase